MPYLNNTFFAPRASRRTARGFNIVKGIIAGLVAVLLAFVVYAGVFMWQKAGRSSGSPSQKEYTLPPITAVSPQLLIRDYSPSQGPVSAPLTIVEFADFECPYCEESFPVIRSLLLEDKYKDKIHFVFRNFPVVSLPGHENAMAAAEAAACAAAQGKFWPYHDRLFQNQNQLDNDSLQRYAMQSGLNTTEFNQCVATRQYQSQVAADISDGQALGVTGTPTWFLNGRKIEGAIPEDIFRKVIEQMLKP